VKQRIAREFHYAEDRDEDRDVGRGSEEEEEEDDPLEAFMAGIEVLRQGLFLITRRDKRFV